MLKTIELEDRLDRVTTGLREMEHLLHNVIYQNVEDVNKIRMYFTEAYDIMKSALDDSDERTI